MKKFWAGLLLALTLTVTAVLPAQASMISQEDEISMGRQTAQQLEARYGLYQDPEASERVSRIGQSLVEVCDRKGLPYSFKILNTDDVNAVSCPGGFIYVNKGLLDYMPSDSELAGVLGHEIGHVVKKHVVNQIEKNLWTNLAMIIATGGRDIGLAMAASQVLTAGYSRTDERGADKMGFKYSVKAGYNPYSMLITMYKLEDLAKKQGSPNNGLFSSHPEPEEREKRMKQLLEPLQINPGVVPHQDSAEVVDGSWHFNITQTVGSDKPMYRALSLAGGLYAARERGPVAPEKFLVDDRGSEATLYYDDLQLLTLYPIDASGFDSVGAYANACVKILRDWAPIANARPFVKPNVEKIK